MGEGEGEGEGYRVRVRVRVRVCTSHSSHAPMPSLGWMVPGLHSVWLGFG